MNWLDKVFQPPSISCDVCGKTFSRKGYFVLLPVDQYGDPIGQNMAICSNTCLRSAPGRVDRTGGDGGKEGTGWAVQRGEAKCAS